MELAPFIVDIAVDSEIDYNEIVAMHISWINTRIEFLFDLEKSNRYEYGAGILVGIEDKDFPEHYNLSWVKAESLAKEFSDDIKNRIGNENVVIALVSLTEGRSYNLIYQLDMDKINYHIALNNIKNDFS